MSRKSLGACLSLSLQEEESLPETQPGDLFAAAEAAEAAQAAEMTTTEEDGKIEVHVMAQGEAGRVGWGWTWAQGHWEMWG